MAKGKRATNGNQFISTVKVGPKGQIVIPKEIREMFDLEPGDSLMIMADQKKGIALHRLSIFSGIADAIFAGRAQEIYPEQPEEHSRIFAEAIKELEAEDQKKKPPEKEDIP